MANLLDSNTHKGTLGELLVQLKLLIFNIESFPPLKDSGNDLIAFFGKSFKAIQVKTKQYCTGWEVPQDRIYHILALVDLDNDLLLDRSRVFMFTRKEAEERRKEIRSGDIDEKFLLTEDRIMNLREQDRQHLF